MNFLRRLLWVRADWDEAWETKKPFVRAAIDNGADAVLIKAEEASEVLKLGTILMAAEKPAPGISIAVLKLERGERVEELLKRAKNLRDQLKVAVQVEVSSKEMERAAAEVGKSVDYLIVVTPDWKIIPLENLIAELQRSDVKVLAGVKDAAEAKVAVETLEVGTAGVLLDARERGPEEVKKVGELFESLEREKLELVPAKVKSARPVGMGDRACIDTTSLMSLGEGMLVGSQSSGMFLVHSETLASEFVAPRPFRVNAGAVHSYVRVPGGKTKYMSELSAGDEVLLVNCKGETRVATVGRVKIERRPLLLVEVEHGGEIYKTLLQNAETINLVGKDGNPISVTKLRPGDEVLIHVEKTGRHFGVKVEETVVEK
ncbi:MAG: 3-dehydroquinate synthase II [Candidatus Hadarchaeum sp.]|uniref:3-dehydroquinate synthase II n=1 Tax=Candidatus Hadarchaeum sp. TaxID=2883567 RepID=UPI003D0AFC5C